jgi:hypothetical protein
VSPAEVQAHAAAGTLAAACIREPVDTFASALDLAWLGLLALECAAVARTHATTPRSDNDSR